VRRRRRLSALLYLFLAFRRKRLFARVSLPRAVCVCAQRDGCLAPGLCFSRRNVTLWSIALQSADANQHTLLWLGCMHVFAHVKGARAAMEWMGLAGAKSCVPALLTRDHCQSAPAHTIYTPRPVVQCLQIRFRAAVCSEISCTYSLLWAQRLMNILGAIVGRFRINFFESTQLR
jgi:hypothetical protein